MKRLFLLGVLYHLVVPLLAQPKNDPWLEALLKEKGNTLLNTVLAQPDSFQYQIIYTRIDRDKKNRPHFTNYYLNVDRERYFNPASTVKLPTAIIALEKLNEQKIKGVNKYTALQIDSSSEGQSPVLSDTSSENGLPSIAHYIKKVFLVSDNDAYNRLYEFTGQQYLNEKLLAKGYPDVRITRRFVPMTPEQNRHTNAFRFLNNGNLIHQQPAAYSTFSFDFSRKYVVGWAHLDRKDSLIREPMDFTTHNNLPLEDLHMIVRTVLFPQSVPRLRRFNLTHDDYRFLYRMMSALPSESRYPAYDTTEFFDSYTKFFFKGGKRKIPPGIRIFNKTGWSYGFLTDAAYVTDSINGIEFMLSAVIYVNSDGVLNDNRYEYEQTGYPFFSELYRIIYDLEKGRSKQYVPRFTEFELRTEND